MHVAIVGINQRLVSACGPIFVTCGVALVLPVSAVPSMRDHAITNDVVCTNAAEDFSYAAGIRGQLETDQAIEVCSGGAGQHGSVVLQLGEVNARSGWLSVSRTTGERRLAYPCRSDARSFWRQSAYLIGLDDDPVRLSTGLVWKRSCPVVSVLRPCRRTRRRALDFYDPTTGSRVERELQSRKVAPRSAYRLGWSRCRSVNQRRVHTALQRRRDSVLWQINHSLICRTVAVVRGARLVDSDGECFACRSRYVVGYANRWRGSLCDRRRTRDDASSRGECKSSW